MTTNNATSFLISVKLLRRTFAKLCLDVGSVGMFALMLFVFVGCRTSDVPGFKQLAEREDNRITAQTKEAIQQSPLLQEIDRKCAGEIVHPADFVLVSMRRDPHLDRLSYGYRSKGSYLDVKRYYMEHLGINGWRLTNSQDKGWGLPFIELQKENYQVRVSYQGNGAELNYTVSCGRLGPNIP